MERLPIDNKEMDLKCGYSNIKDKVNEIIDWINNEDIHKFKCAIKKAKKEMEKRKDCALYWDKEKNTVVWINVKTGKIEE